MQKHGKTGLHAKIGTGAEFATRASTRYMASLEQNNKQKQSRKGINQSLKQPVGAKSSGITRKESGVMKNAKDPSNKELSVRNNTSNPLNPVILGEKRLANITSKSNSTDSNSGNPHNRRFVSVPSISREEAKVADEELEVGKKSKEHTARASSMKQPLKDAKNAKVTVEVVRKLKETAVIAKNSISNAEFSESKEKIDAGKKRSKKAIVQDVYFGEIRMKTRHCQYVDVVKPSTNRK